MVAGRLVEKHRARILVYVATALVLAQPVIFGAPAQRLMQVLGFDFLVTALLAVFLTIAILEPAS
jgi:hypothetical protein